jgi:hypothetical protein
MAEHWIRCKRNYKGDVYWTCCSSWDLKSRHSRLRTEVMRHTTYGDVRQARRWAKKYRVDLPTEPEPPK